MNSFPEGLRNITLRDYLAANERTLPSEQWLNRACHGRPLAEFPHSKQASLICSYRYFMADAMLSARSRLADTPTKQHAHI